MLGFAQLASMLLGIGTNSLWARGVSKEIFGQYQLILSFATMIGTLCLNGLSQSLTISSAKNCDGDLPKIISLKLGISLIGGIALASVGLYYRSKNPLLAESIFLLSFFFPFLELAKVWLYWMQGKYKFSWVVTFQILYPAVFLLTLATCIYMRWTSLKQLVCLLQGSAALVTLASLFFLFSKMKHNNAHHPDTLRYGLHITAASLLAWLVITDKFIINEHLSAAAVAIYSVALIFPEQVKMVYVVFGQSFDPFLASANSVHEAWAFLKPKLILVWALFILLGILGFIILPYFIPLIFSEKYAVAAPYGKWLWLVMSVTAPATYLGNLLRAQRKVKFVYGFEISNALMSALLYIVLVHYGLWGMVAAQALRNTFAAVFFVIIFVFYFKREQHG